MKMVRSNYLPGPLVFIATLLLQLVHRTNSLAHVSRATQQYANQMYRFQKKHGILNGQDNLTRSRSIHSPFIQRMVSSSVSATGEQLALLFDCDGVIVETEELHRQAYNKAFEKYDLKLPSGEIVKWSEHYYDRLANTVGGGKPKMMWVHSLVLIYTSILMLCLMYLS